MKLASARFEFKMQKKEKIALAVLADASTTLPIYHLIFPFIGDQNELYEMIVSQCSTNITKQ